MKVISFFSRFTLICNIAFLLFIFFSRYEMAKSGSQGAPGTVSTIPFIKNLVITLGFSSIVINFLMCLVYTILVFAGRTQLLTKWLVAVNVLFLILQFYYFFF